MRLVPAALAALLAAPLALAPAAPAAAQDCDCGFGAPPAYVETGPATLVVPRTTYVPHTRYARETVLVPRTRLVPRVVYVPRTRLERRTVAVPRTVYSAHTSYTAYPAPGGGYPSGYRYGATYVPPGTTYGCTLGLVGCDSSAVGPIGY
ncbi:hypothetical protein D3273_26080 [Lichenibacterium minor]|uniref:Uncharacterized protein n=1 Tax=Lichenibacterium minor TaxID=2316528 RepID=A0A4Q2U2W0_9HYPH|nr:hypothetical protein [Lichenibacterium minor]RYC29035.1 hypothetical protein D3273_26080 [Lichenibacterium minor]